MHLKIVLKRLLSNKIDFILFLSTYLLLVYLSEINRTQSNLIYVTLVAFILYFTVPILTINNTFGKAILKIEWKNSENVKHLLLFKYIFYFTFFIPSFSLVSTITNFPYLNNTEYDKILTIQLVSSLIIINIIILIIGLGKYHALDYILNLEIKYLEYSRKPLLSLFYMLLFVSSFIILSFISYRFNISFQKINNTFAKEVYWENFSDDLFHGNKPMVIKKKSNEVFTPSETLSFLFNKEFNQKTIYLMIPEKIFYSTSDRKAICYNLLRESIDNDIFYNFDPSQTKIVLTTIKEGYFFEYYNYSYTYYFDKNFPDLGIYGGIIGDSLTPTKYLNFVKSVKLKQNSLSEAFKHTKKEKKFYALKASLNYKQYNIFVEDVKISFDFIRFEDVKMKTNMQLNFPPQSVIYRTNFFNIVGDDLQIDDNIYYLKFARDEISNEYL